MGTEADDGLPSFPPDVATPENPAGPDDEQGPEGAVPDDGAPLINDGLSLLSLMDETRGIDGQDEGTRTPEVGGGGLAMYEGAAGVGAPPPGVISPRGHGLRWRTRGRDWARQRWRCERRAPGGSLGIGERLGGAPSGAHADSTGAPGGR